MHLFRQLHAPMMSRVIFMIVLVILGASPAGAERLSPLAASPDWKRLDPFQETITRGEFTRLLDAVYAPGGAWQGVITIGESAAEIARVFGQQEKYILRFAKDTSTARRAPRAWRHPSEFGAAQHDKPLAGLKLALDPGHIGGDWALMEERSFARPGDPPVREGDMTLLVAKLVAHEARALGADVTLVREKNSPLSPFTIDALREPARRELSLLAVADIRETYESPSDPLKMNTVQWQAERLFYRVAEIRERARIVNTVIRPDLVICIHFNADDWINPADPVFTERDDLHVLIHGCYSAAELHFDDQRMEMLVKLLNHSHSAEITAARFITDSLRRATELPPFAYIAGNATRVGDDEYLWARNLLANRLYEAPCVYLEPWRMNNPTTYSRIQLGDYEGLRDVAGKPRRSIFREYADALIEGLKNHLRSARNGR